MLKIKLKRTGRKKKPCYKIIITENLSKRDGKCLAIIGYYNPLTKKININNFLLYKYINFGAYPTNSVRHLIYTLISKKYL